jgi:hypothetical protein
MKRASPEVMPYLFLLSLEMSQVPNKDKLIARMQPVLGIEPGTENMSAEELRQHAVEKAEGAAQEAAKQAQLAEAEFNAKLEGEQADTKETLADAEKKLAEAQKALVEADKIKAELSAMQFQAGLQFGQSAVDGGGLSLGTSQP